MGLFWGEKKRGGKEGTQKCENVFVSKTTNIEPTFISPTNHFLIPPITQSRYHQPPRHIGGNQSGRFWPHYSFRLFCRPRRRKRFYDKMSSFSASSLHIFPCGNPTPPLYFFLSRSFLAYVSIIYLPFPHHKRLAVRILSSPLSPLRPHSRFPPPTPKRPTFLSLFFYLRFK